MAETVDLAAEFSPPDTQGAAPARASIADEFEPPPRATQIAVANDAHEKASAWGKSFRANETPAKGLQVLKNALQDAVGGDLPNLWTDFTTPIVSGIPRAKLPSLEESPDSAIAALAATNPQVPVLAGAYNTAASVAESFSSPLNIATLGTFGALTKLAQGVGPAAAAAKHALTFLKVGFGAQMAHEAGGQAGKASVDVADPNQSLQQKTESVLAPVASGAMAVLSAAHGASDVVNAGRRISSMPAVEKAAVIAESAPPEVQQVAPSASEAAPAVAGPETVKLQETPSGAQKLETIKEALKSPDTVIQYSVWDQGMLPPGADRVAQVDLINPKDTQSVGGIASTNRKLLQELGQDVPEAPPWLEPGRYTREEIKTAIAEGPPKIADEFAPPEGVPPDKPMVGLGAASPEEFKPVREFETSIKNAVVDEQRKARGLPPAMEEAAKGFGKTWDEAMAKIAEDQNAPDALISELKDSPRAVTDVESAMLLHREIDLQNTFDRVTRNIDENIGTPDSIAADKTTQSRVLDELNDLYDVTRKAGTETGRGLAARKMIAAEDFSLAKMLTKRRVAKGGAKLTPEEEAAVREQHAAIEEAQRALDEHEAQRELDAAITTPEGAQAQIAKLEETEAPKGASDKRLTALKRRTRKRIDDLRKKIETGDFSKPERIPVEKDAEANRLQAELDTAKEDFNKALERDRYDQLTGIQKLRENAVNMYDAARNLMTTGEFSFVLRQGKMSAVSHPVISAKAIPNAFRALLSDPVTARAIDLETINHPDAPAAIAAKLHLVEEGERLSAQDEAFASRWAEEVPVLRNFNQAGRVFLNKLRFDIWRNLRQAIDNPTPEQDKQLALFVNESTGRGGLGKLEPAAVAAGRILFSPRYLASRIQLAVGHSMWGGDFTTRRLIATEYARALVGLGVYYSALKLALTSQDEKRPKPEVSFDPRSSDFGKVKIGNTRIDPLAGISQVVVFGARTASGEKTTQKGRVVPIRGKVPYGGAKWTDVAASFARSKLHPVPGAIVNIFDGTDLAGQPVTIQSQALNLVAPLTYVDVYQALEEQDLPEGAALSLLAMLGEGLQTYKPAEKKKKQMGQPTPPSNAVPK